MRSRTRQLLRPEDVEHVRDLGLIARWIVEGTLIGLHRSPAHGFSVEFAEYREYTPGDDLRHFDWKALGRSDRRYIKKFHTETNARLSIVLDASASMKYGNPEKFHYARCVAAALCYLAVHQQDSAEIHVLGGEGTERLPAVTSPSRLSGLFEPLGRLAPGSRSQLAPALHDLAEDLKRRGMVILLSDLYDEDSQVVDAVRHLRFRGHEVVVFHVLDETELHFDFEHVRDFVDLETGRRLEVHGPAFRDAYRKRVADWLAAYERQLNDCRAEHVRVETSEPFASALVEYLNRRKSTRLGP